VLPNGIEEGTVTFLHAHGRIARSILLALAGAVLPCTAIGEVSSIKIGRSFSLGQLPAIVMEQNHLVEKHAKAAGLDLKVEWQRFAGASAENDALLSGSVAFTLNGVPGLLILWDKTHGEVRGVAAADAESMFLNTRDPKVKSIRDFTNDDKIAVPAVRVSVTAIQLQMAAAKAFGEENLHKHDPFTVSLSNPDGMIALLSNSEVNSHFTVEPYSTRELQHPDVHTVLRSDDTLGGQGTLNVFVATEKFRRENPKVYHAFVEALKEADESINRDKKAAAQIYVSQSKGFTFDEVYKVLEENKIQFSMAPLQTMKYAAFLHKIGTIKTMPTSWKDYFFQDPTLAAMPGS
jgi:NitT/TauT family transport system substrate-binding protein